MSKELYSANLPWVNEDAIAYSVEALHQKIKDDLKRPEVDDYVYMQRSLYIYVWRLVENKSVFLRGEQVARIRMRAKVYSYGLEKVEGFENRVEDCELEKLEGGE
jgi:hypothetical protein